MLKILLLNGPNLNLLGKREPDHYGSETLESVQQRIVAEAESAGYQLDSMQSNSEQELIERIHKAGADGGSFILFNPAAFTHTSVALRDALLGTAIPFIEIHLSNTMAREDFRHRSYFSDIAEGVIIGLGVDGYSFALQAAVKSLTSSQINS